MEISLLILAGSDPLSTREGGEDWRRLCSGCSQEKALLQIEGRALIEWALQTYSAQFSDIFIAGTHQSYHHLKGSLNVRDVLDYGPVPVGTRLRKSLTAIAANGRSQVVVTTCDILPSGEDVEKVIDRYQSLRASDDVAVLLPFCASQRQGMLGKHVYPFEYADSDLSYGLLAHFWPINSASAVAAH